MPRSPLWRLPLAALLAASLVALAAAQSVPAPGEKEKTIPSASTPEVVLTPEGFQELLDEIARLRKLLEPPRPRIRTPSKLVLKGKVEGSLVQLTAQFDFATEKPGEQLRLGCGLAFATAVSLDGKTPPLIRLKPRPGSSAGGKSADELDGFAVEIDKPGVHQLTLELLLAVTARPGGQSLTLDLPRAPISRLELELPPGARDIRLGNKPLAETLLSHKGNQLTGPLGATDRLELTWRTAGVLAAQLSAEGLVQVHITPKGLSSEARLNLQVAGGVVRQWRLVVPPRAELKLSASEQARVERIEVKDQKSTSLRIIHLKEASAESLEVTIHVPASVVQPGTGKSVAVGPFDVLGAVRQHGSVLVSSRVPDWHLEFTTHGDLTRREATDEEVRRDPSLRAAFRYGPGKALAGAAALAGGGSPTDRRDAGPTDRRDAGPTDRRDAGPTDRRDAGPTRIFPGSGSRSPGSWLDIEAFAVRGQVQVRAAHTIRLAEAEGGGAARWQVQTVLTVTPRWSDLERLSVQLPAGSVWQDEGSYPLPARVRSVSYQPGTHTVEFRLARSDGAGPLLPFTVQVETLSGESVDVGTAGQGKLGLPRPVGTTEQDATVTVQVPGGVEVLPSEEEGAGGEMLRQTTHELTWRWPRRTPERVTFRYRPYRPFVQVSGVVDVTLVGREGRVRHELRYRLPGGQGGSGKDSPPHQASEEKGAAAPVRSLALRVPGAVAGSLRLVQGGRADGEKRGPASEDQVLTVNVSEPGNPVLVLEYAFALPEAGRGADDRRDAGATVAVPLVVPLGVMRGETKVRIWSEGGQMPAPRAEGWREDNIEEVAERSALPVLVLRCPEVNRPLTLRLGSQAVTGTALIERALVRVEWMGGLTHAYRVSYRLSRLAGRKLDVEMPAQVPYINLQVRLNGKRIEPEVLAAERAEQRARIARLRLAPELVGKAAVLEISYQLTPDRGGMALATLLQPPRPLDGPDSVPTRWQIVAPPGRVVLGPEAGAGSPRTWGRRGWLLAPRSALSAGDLERWFAGGDPPATEATSSATPTLVLWRDGASAVTLVHVPQQAWLLACSLTLVLLGLAVSRLPFSETTGQTPAWVWLLLAALLVAGIAAILIWPTLAGQIAYGCQPGAAVLLLIAALQWLLHERYRRQIVFLPSFTRPRSGSSMARKEGSRPPGEPSTVDAPRTPGSSIERL